MSSERNPVLPIAVWQLTGPDGHTFYSTSANLVDWYINEARHTAKALVDRDVALDVIEKLTAPAETE